MEVSNPYYTINNGFLLQSRSSHRPFILFSEFVEVVLLPLDEFQMKIDGEVSDFSHGDHPQTLFFSHYLTCFFFFFVLPLQSWWRKKKSLWTPKCTSLPWGWSRPSLSRGSCPSWSSEAERSGWEREEEIVFAVTWGSYTGLQNFVLERKLNASKLIWRSCVKRCCCIVVSILM